MPERSFDVEALLKLPRLSGLALSPDGERLAVSVARPDAEGKRFVSALYELDPGGKRPPRRLTRSTPGESGAAFAPDGSLLFSSSRPDPDAGSEDPRGERAALWRLPPGGGEAHLLAGPPGGVGAFAVARGSGTLLFAANRHPGAADGTEDAAKEKARKEAGVEAQLFEEYPIRYWDHYLGPRRPHLRLASLPEGEGPVEAEKDLTPLLGRPLDEPEMSLDLTPDGSTAVATRGREDRGLRQRFSELVAMDVNVAKARVLAGDEASYSDVACSPDGRLVVAVRWGLSTPEKPADKTLWIIDLETGEGRDLLQGFDLWPEGPVWAPDSGSIFFVADEDGNAPVFKIDVGSGTLTRLARSGAFTDPCPSPDGRTLYALRSTVGEAPHPVALDAGAEEAEPRRLPGFEETEGPEPLARIERITTETAEGMRVRSWLVLPPGASGQEPAPLATFIHGGPLSTWNGWHWRWNPHVFASEGWAVLLPDPALSTGYGMDHIRRGWGRWGEVVYRDLLRVVDRVVARKDIDAGKTVAMGGSFGGYMANWIAVHTDRFGAIVAHASVWDLESFHGETDLGWFWEREFGDPYKDASRYRKNSPRPHVAKIRTPMLVIHGELDYRVAIGEALQLWTDLKRNGVAAKFLYFPDENHWITKPNNIRIWYRTVLNFIDYHARGREWKKHDLL